MVEAGRGDAIPIMRLVLPNVGIWRTVGIGHGFLHDCWAAQFYERDINYLVFVCFLCIQVPLELVPPMGLRFEKTLDVWCDRCLRLLNAIGGEVSGAQF
jgi:hypothetical protein